MNCAQFSFLLLFVVAPLSCQRLHNQFELANVKETINDQISLNDLKETTELTTIQSVTDEETTLAGK